MYLFVIWKSSLVKCLFKSFAYLVSGLLYMKKKNLFSYSEILYSGYKFLIGCRTWKYSQIVAVFILLSVSLEEETFYILMKTNLQLIP